MERTEGAWREGEPEHVPAPVPTPAGAGAGGDLQFDEAHAAADDGAHAEPVTRAPESSFEDPNDR